MAPTEKGYQAFHRHVRKGSPDQCWEWLGATMPNGYGRVKLGGRAWLAHRAAYFMAHGSIPTPRKKGHAATVIRHTCDNRRCCNPAHLIPGTAKDNATDLVRRRRHPHHRDDSVTQV